MEFSARPPPVPNGRRGRLGYLAIKLTYSKHAKERMAERDISESEVEQVLEAPDIDYHDPKGSPIFVRQIGGRRIKVVVVQGSNPPHVITAGD